MAATQLSNLDQPRCQSSSLTVCCDSSKHTAVVAVAAVGKGYQPAGYEPAVCWHITGTPNYLAPEMINCEPYNQKADVWACGCVLYEMAALRPAFKVIA